VSKLPRTKNDEFQIAKNPIWRWRLIPSGQENEFSLRHLSDKKIPCDPGKTLTANWAVFDKNFTQI
jgi:hypothetical protein